MGRFEVMGEAYVHSIMAGEALSKIKETTWWEDLLCSRPLKRVRWLEVAIHRDRPLSQNARQQEVRLSLLSRKLDVGHTCLVLIDEIGYDHNDI
ncbi:heterokaryon incompatibility protein [Colletotrichum chrysophilum]|uniref:Heterokaryon incompatibility protein n=1 Tax=Colletotrichum chrysophilum TaxID=1836956 RepID=A0AAD9ABB5_9PEZI|nr:heterokaryon incompatibility protein [Colletotrichum chrysophilum]